MKRLTQRADFLAAARAAKVFASSFILQALDRGDGLEPRVGFTVSKKVGNAVVRNRVRRRLREMARHSQTSFRAGCDYVVIGRRETLTCGFEQILQDLTKAIRRIHSTPGPATSAKSKTA